MNMMIEEEEPPTTIPLESLVLFQTEFVIALTKPTKSAFRQGRAFVLEADEEGGVVANRAVPFHSSRGKRRQRWRLSAEGFIQNVLSGLVMEPNITWTGSSAVVRPLSAPPKPTQRWTVKWTCSDSANKIKSNPDMVPSCCTTITSKVTPSLGLDVKWGKIVEGATVCVVPPMSRSRKHRKWWLCPILDNNNNQDSKRITARPLVLSPATRAALRSSMSMRSLSRKDRDRSNSSSSNSESRKSLPSPLRQRDKILVSSSSARLTTQQAQKQHHHQYRERQNSQIEHRHRFEKLLHKKRGPRRSLASDERTILRGAFLLAEAAKREKKPTERIRSRTTVDAVKNKKTPKLNEIMGNSKSFRNIMVSSSRRILSDGNVSDEDLSIPPIVVTSTPKQKQISSSSSNINKNNITVADLRRYRQKLSKIRNAFDLESKITTQLSSNISREWRARRRLLRRWGLDTDSNMCLVVDTQENLADEIMMLRKQIYLASSALIADQCEITRSSINSASFKSNASVRHNKVASKRLLGLHGWIVKQSRGSNLRWKWQRRWFRVSLNADDVAAARSAAVEKEAHRGWRRSRSSGNVSENLEEEKDEDEEMEDKESVGRLRTSSEIPVETFSNRVAAAMTPISLVYYASPTEQQLRRADFSSNKTTLRTTRKDSLDEAQPNGLFPICADSKIQELDLSLEFFDSETSSPTRRRRSWFGGPPYPFGAELRSDEAGVRVVFFSSSLPFISITKTTTTTTTGTTTKTVLRVERRSRSMD